MDFEDVARELMIEAAIKVLKWGFIIAAAALVGHIFFAVTGW